ncbi:ABC transporter ATP-binding protein [Paenibacillus sp. GCM10012307]|uniref:ABC transporter ATP-binding protein n=1 Tax=Paenibacillus roseus TaxID=2798579 RepID=A0A934J2U4_9BACL|nr:ABC transporter ATP-binding protein [Paenibacillus roseus]MBJ6360574.1 ABC transporter ATP-binding protein [Paenibacillus roseus]
MEQATIKAGNQSSPSQKRQLLKIYWWTLSFIKPYKGLFVTSLFLGLMIASAQIVIPKFIQMLVDDVLPSNDLLRYREILAVLSGVITIVIIATILKYVTDRKVQEWVAGDMQIGVFQKMRSLGYSFYEKYPVGEIYSLFHTEVEAIQKINRQYLPTIVQYTISFAVTFTFMAMLNWKLSLVFIPGILIYYLIGPYFERKSAEYAKKLADSHAELNKKQYDSISAMMELRAYGQEKWNLDQLLKQDQKTAAINVIFFKLINYRGAFRRVAVYFSGILMFVSGYYLVSKGLLTIGEFIAFTILYYKVMFDLTILITNLTEQRVLLHQTIRLYSFMELAPDVEEIEHPEELSQVRGGIEFRNIRFGYTSSSDVVKNINLSIQPGEKVALVGTSGHGKSSLIKLLARFYDPSEGTVYLDNVNLTQLSLKQLRESIGYVFQETYLYGDTIKENIQFGNENATDEDIIVAAKAASAHEFIIALPEGYDTVIGERGNKLSGGQRQRIAIARMILKNPRIIVLDEATSALDHENEAEVKKALDQLFKGRTTIAVAHRISTIQHFDKIVVVENGEIAEVGTYDSLLERRGAFYQLLMGEKRSAANT